jgi:hypothetical protein
MPTGGDSAADAIVSRFRQPHWPPLSRISGPRQYPGAVGHHKSPSWCHSAPPPAILETKHARGTANIEPVTAETALKVGRVAAHVFKTL